MDLYQQFIHMSRYSRYREDLGRRETWQETVQRTVDYLFEGIEDETSKQEVYDAILNLEVMPSMRLMMTAGDAHRRDSVASYNCCFTTIDDVRVFDEIMYILMCGTGVGFSVENQFVSKLPVIAEEFYPTDTVIRVADSKIGWATSFRELVSLLYAGKVPSWDVSKIRPEGAPLKTFGGRASGPEPLVSLFEFTVRLFKNATGRQLTSIECHDLVCKIADIVVVGGVRRSALISLSDLGDDRMRYAKSGQWWLTEGQRALANNSAVYNSKPEINTFLREWIALYESKSGERGLFNRANITRYSPRRKTEGVVFGTNPCSEIVLRPQQFCNLTEVVIRPHDTKEDLQRKVRIASLIGTIQSSYTNFRYLRSIWRRNCEDERLLGVSLTGICDNPLTSTVGAQLNNLLDHLREVAIETNALYAEKLNINPSTAITCTKPSGTVSQLCGTSSGIHPAYNDYYVRRVRNSVTDPISDFMIRAGVPAEFDVTNDRSYVFSFPRHIDTKITRHNFDALAQLELYKAYRTHWAEHSISTTIYVAEHEWISVGAWVYQNFDIVAGLSFLPKEDDGHVYRQAPYEDITADVYADMLTKIPQSLDWSKMVEHSDTTLGSQTLACSAGGCEI